MSPQPTVGRAVHSDQVLRRRCVVDLDGYFYLGGLPLREERRFVVVGVVGVRGVLGGCASYALWSADVVREQRCRAYQQYCGDESHIVVFCASGLVLGL